MANKLIEQRLEGVLKMLLTLYQASDEVLGSQHSAITGPEREIFVAHFLSQILPPHYRIGSGIITDAEGAISTQFDVVIELPFAPSFSFLDGTPRIYLADTIGAIIEIKSDLAGSNVYEKFVSGNQYTPLKQISRKVMITNLDEGITIKESNTIPSYVVTYKGYANPDPIVNLIAKINQTEPPTDIVRGILQLGYKPENSKVVNPKTFFVGSKGQIWEGPAAIGVFIHSLHWELHRTSPLSWPNLLAYFGESESAS